MLLQCCEECWEWEGGGEGEGDGRDGCVRAREHLISVERRAPRPKAQVVRGGEATSTCDTYMAKYVAWQGWGA